jgi:carbamoyltransferase
VICKDKRLPMTEEQNKLFGIDLLNIPRSQVPAIKHVDYSARIQTVHVETNPRFYEVTQEFEKATQCPVLINTSSMFVASILSAHRNRHSTISYLQK